MRTRHWLAALTSGCMAFAGIGTAVAQQPVPPAYGNPDQVGLGMLPPPMNTGYGPSQSQIEGPFPPGYPPDANSWPGISPFEGPMYNQTVYENGFWWNRMKSGGRTYYGNVEAIFSKASKPSTATIGADNVNPLAELNRRFVASGTTTGTGTGSGTGSGTVFIITQLNQIGSAQTFFPQPFPFNQSPDGPGPVRSTSSSTSTGGAAGGGGTGGTGGGGASGTATATIDLFPVMDTGILADTLTSSGFRGTVGYWNGDDTGLSVSGFIQSRTSSEYLLSDPTLNLDPNSPLFNPNQLHAWFGLPLSGADTDGTNIGTIQDGAVVPYDMAVKIRFESSLAGANVDWYFNTIYEKGQIKVRPTTGVRWFNLSESFQFDGYDSGLGYTVSAGSTTGAGGAGGGTGGTGGTGGGSTTTGGVGLFTPSTFQDTFFIPNVTHSQLNSITQANLGGPEFGFRIDMGSKNFQMWTSTKGGFLANVSQREVNGFNIGNTFNILPGYNAPALPNDPNLTQFTNKYTSTTMSPMFEQQINVKFPVFHLIPYLNKVAFLEKAQLTGGYTFLYLDGIYRPHSDIQWNQTVVNVTTDPTTGASQSLVGITPQLNNTKSNYFNSMFNVGLEWQY